MADIAHTVPAIVTALDGSTYGFERPGLQVAQFDAGPYRSRDWLGYNLRAYDLNPSLWQSSTTALEQWSAFWHHIGGGSECGYIVEPLSETHRDLICGGIADGSQTTFSIPVVSPSSVIVFVDGVPQEASAYTLHSAANLLSDVSAECSDASTMIFVNATESDSTVSYDGLTGIKLVPAGGAVPVIRTPLTSGVSAAEEYTAVGAVRVTNASGQNYRIRIRWAESDDTEISVSNGSDVSVDAADGWVVLSVTATSPALSAQFQVQVERNDSSGTTPFYADCLGLAPGDYDRFHLPSQCPGLIEFGSAPASGARITATATGCRLTRCRFSQGSSWRMTSPGHAASRSISAVESVEV